MCDIWKINKEDKTAFKRELTIPDIIDFFEKNKHRLRKLKNIGITGGEPTLKQDLPDLFSYLRKEYPKTRIGIQTHGLFPKVQLKMIQKIYDIYPDIGLAVSLDGVGETHAKVRGVAGAYEKALTTIKQSKEIGIKEITVGLTISSENIEQIPEVERVCKELGCEFSCFLAEEGDYFDNADNSATAFTEDERLNIIQKLKTFDYHYYMDNVRLQLLGKRKRELTCYSGRTSIVVDPYGDIRPCLILDETFGNIKQRSLDDVMTSDETVEKLTKLKSCKECFLQCEVGASVLTDFSDLIRWFVFHSENRTGFLKTYLSKYNKTFFKDI